MKIAIVDVCNTLYSTNTTFSFVDFVMREKYNKKVFIKNTVFKVPLLIIGRILNRDIYRNLYIDMLKGISKNDLHQYAEHYYLNFLRTLERKQIFELIKNNKGEYHFYLCSASLDVIIEAIMEHNDFFEREFYSSKLNIINNICTGSLNDDLLGNKHHHIDKLDWIITDNKSDLILAKKAKKTTIIAKNKDIEFWNKNGLEVNFII